MYPKLYDKFGRLQAVLDNIINDSAKIKRVVNGEFTFTFEAFESELKSEYFDTESRLVLDNQSFDIKYIEQTHDTEVKYSIQCEHVNYRMADGDANKYTSYTGAGTPTQILTNILSGTEFSVGVVEFTDVVAFTVNTEITRKSLIYQLVNMIGGEIEYTNGGFTINILNTIGNDNGFQVRFGKNLRGIKKIIDSRGGLKTSYDVDIVELKNSNEYIEKQLQDLEVISIGDTVRIIDEVIGLDIQNRILSIEYNPIFAINTKLEIANTIDLISDTITQIDSSKVTQGTIYNGVKISPEEGFISERSDGKAKTSMNSTEGIYIRSDTGNGLQPVFYVDMNGRIKGKELDVDGSGTFAGTLNITNGPINVKIAPSGDNSFIILYEGEPILNVDNTGKITTNNGVFRGVLEATTMRSEWTLDNIKRIMHITDSHFEVEYQEDGVTKHVTDVVSDGFMTRDYVTGGNGFYGPNGIDIGPTEGGLFSVKPEAITYKGSPLIQSNNVGMFVTPASIGAAPTDHLQSSYTITPMTNSDQTIGLYYNTPVATPSYCWANFEPRVASDFRLKKDIQTLDIPTELFMKIKAKQFTFKTDTYPTGIHFGVLSQELESLFLEYGLNPSDYNLFELEEVKAYKDDGLYVDDKVHRVNYNNFIALLISMIQQHQNKIDELEQRISKLEPDIVLTNKEVNNE